MPYNLRPAPEMREMLRAQAGDVDFAEHFGHDVRYVALALPRRPEEVPEAELAVDPQGWVAFEIARKQILTIEFSTRNGAR